MKACSYRRAGQPRLRSEADQVGPVRVIVDVLPHVDHTTLVVSEPGRASRTVQLAVSPAKDSVDLPIHARPLAVRFDVSSGTRRCSCLVTTPDGPRRVEISIAEGLSLVASGVHGILATASADPLRGGQRAASV